MILGPKTVLLADDDPATVALYRHGLPTHLPGFDLATVADGGAAIAYLSEHPVAVLVTDIAMPGKDGFEVLAFVRNHHPNLAVVVLTAMPPQRVADGLPRLGAMQVLQKPVPPALLAERILTAYGETARGKLSDVPLATLLQLVQTERKSCSLHLRHGDQRGRLHFLAGELVNAYAFELDAEGEAAARHLLSWEGATVEFERSLHNHVRTIQTPLTTLLLDVLREADETRHRHTKLQAAAPRAVVAPVGPPVAVAAGHPAHAGPDLGAAADRLQGALADLRHAVANAAERLERAAPEVRDGARAAVAARTASPRHGADADRLARARQEVAALALRLARAAEALGAPVVSATAPAGRPPAERPPA